MLFRRRSLALALLLLGCDDPKKPAPAPAPSASLTVATSAEPPLPSATSVEREEAPAARELIEAAPGTVVEIGPAGPATASPEGVVMITKSDEVLLAKLGDKKASIARIKAGADMVRAASRGPAVAGGRAYWVSKGRLLRKPLVGGALEVLATDARDGVRVAAATVGSGDSARAVAAYVADAGDSTAAKLWVERAEPWTLTPEGSAATSVALAVAGNKLFALSIEARTGMTPVHARVADFASSPPKLEDDVVVWVTGPAQSLVEIVGIAEPSGAVSAFVPLERDISRFGLAHVQLGPTPKMGSPVSWRAYENGLDPAPLAAEITCGSASVLYTAPEEAKPHAPQELALARLASGKLGPPRLVARSRGVINVSLADTPKGVLVSYVAEQRTWATVIPCPKK